jgi:hypothetical protein
MPARKMLAAKATFACEHNGEQIIVHAGELLAADHPAVKARPGLFGPAGSRLDVEAAEQPPGSKRGQKRARK